MPRSETQTQLRDLADNEGTLATRMESDGVKGRRCGGSDLGLESGGRQPATEKSWLNILRTTRSTESVVGASFQLGAKRLN